MRLGSEQEQKVPFALGAAKTSGCFWPRESLRSRADIAYLGRHENLSSGDKTDICLWPAGSRSMRDLSPLIDRAVSISNRCTSSPVERAAVNEPSSRFSAANFSASG